MSQNLLNLTLIFCLEIANLIVLGYWGWTENNGILRWLLALGLPVIGAAIWGIFRVPGEPSFEPDHPFAKMGNANGEPAKAIVPVRGWLRLLIEFAYFAVGVGLLIISDHTQAALIFGGLVVLHYVLAYDRIIRFITEK